MSENTTKILANARFKPRSDTKENWKTLNPVLLAGEPGVVIDGTETEKIKFGDGITPWNSLGWWKGPKGDKGDKGEKGDPGGGSGGGVVDQTYKPTSSNAQSGKAVAEAISEAIGGVNTVFGLIVEG